jgi:hypothetical protein
MTDPCDHEWRYAGNGIECCELCGEVRDQDYDLDDGRDFTEPYEP